METSWPRGRRKIFQAEGVERAKALGGTRQVFLKAELQVAAGAVAGAAELKDIWTTNISSLT